MASSQGAPQEKETKFRFAIYPQGIRQFHDICQKAMCETVATLAPVYAILCYLSNCVIFCRQMVAKQCWIQ